MATLFILMNIFFFGYVYFITAKYGVQSSVSESYYKLPRNMQWLFTVATWAYALMALIIGLDFTDNGLMFLAGAGICFVGAAPAFHGMGMERKVHVIGAITGISAMVLFMILQGYWYMAAIFVLLSAISALIKSMRVNITWWIEIAAFISLDLMYYSLLIK